MAEKEWSWESDAYWTKEEPSRRWLVEAEETCDRFKMRLCLFHLL